MLSYGENCHFPCSVHCINQTCNRKNGSCLYGCEDGYQCDEGIFFCFQYVTWVFSFHFVYIDSLNLELRLGCLFLTIQINLYIIKITVCHFCRCSKKCKTICFIIGQYTSHSWRDGWRVRDCYNRSSRGFVCYAVCLLVVKK